MKAKLLVAIFFLLFPLLAMAEYRVDLTYSALPLYVDEYWEKEKIYEFRSGSMFFTLEKKLVRAIIPVSATERPSAPKQYVTKEEYERQVREAQEAWRRWEIEWEMKKYEEKLARLQEEREREARWLRWLYYTPTVVYYPAPVYTYPKVYVVPPIYHYYPYGGVYIGGYGRNWWFNVDVPLEHKYYYEERVIVK